MEYYYYVYKVQYTISYQTTQAYSRHLQHETLKRTSHKSHSFRYIRYIIKKLEAWQINSTCAYKLQIVMM